MRPAVSLAIGMLVGAIGGFVAGRKLPEADSGPVRDSTRAEAAPAAVTETAPFELRSAPSTGAPGSSSNRAGAGTQVSLDLKEFFCQSVRPPWAAPSHLDEFWKRHVLGQVAAGRVGVVLDAIDAALAAGAKPDQIELGLHLLSDPKAEARIVAGVRSRHPDLAWTPGFAEATALLDDKSNDSWVAAIRILATAPLDGAGVLVDRVAFALAKIDEIRANRELEALELARRWPSAFVYLVAEGFRNAGFAALADRWVIRTNTAPKSAAEKAEERKQVDARLANAHANLAADPTNTSAFCEIGKCLVELGRTVEAFDAFLKAVEIDPIDSLALSSLMELHPERAAPIVERSLAGANDDDRELLVDAQLVLGKNREAVASLLQRGKGGRMDRVDIAELAPDVTLEALAPYRRNRHVDWETRLTAAKALATLGRTTEAAAEFSATVAEGSEGAWILWAAIQPAEALSAIEERDMESRAGDRREAARGDALLRLGRRDQAKEAFLRAEALAGNSREQDALDAVRLVRVGRILLDPERELPKAVAATRDRPDDASAWGVLGDAYRRLGKLEEARDAYGHAYRASRDVFWLVRRNLCK